MALLIQLFRKARSVLLVSMGNLLARWPRALVALIAVALGVALVTAVTSGYASARRTILDWNYSWVGHSHVHVQPIPSQLWADPRLPSMLAGQVRRLPGVKQVVTRQKEYLLAVTEDLPEGQVIYGYGIELPGETQVRDAGVKLDAGERMLTPGASGEVLVEKHLAEMLGKGVGDSFELVALSLHLRLMPAVIRRRLITRSMRRRFKIVGIITRPRFSMVSSQKVFKLRDLVMMTQADMDRLFTRRPTTQPAGDGHVVGLESIDVILHEPTSRRMAATADRVRGLIDDYNRAHPDRTQDVEVEAADEKLRQLDKNMRLFRLASRTVSVVALLTASYIIFTTLGMGMVQRQAELGMLRCVGAGRVQIAAATFAEALPIAAAGVGLGLVLGLVAAKAVVAYYHVFFTRMVISVPGLVWAGVGGVIAVLLAVALPAYLASRVSPLAASRPQTRRLPLRLDLLLGAVGGAMVGLSFVARTRLGAWQTPDQQAATYVTVGVPMLFLGYFLAAPLIVAGVGWLLKFVAAMLLLVRPRLLDDQMQTARWRTAATLCALMVGISMLVSLRVRSESVIRGWELPTRMPPGFLFFFDALDPPALARVSALPQIVDPIPVTAFWVRYQGRDMQGDASVVVRFLAGPVERFPGLVDLNFIEVLGGREPQWALGEVRRGGSVIATREFATRRQLTVGEKVRFWRHDRDESHSFTVVGIVESPSMDMAIDFLNLRDRFQNLASGTVIGCVPDANRILHREYGPSTAPAARPPAGGAADPPPLLTRILLFDFARDPSAVPGEEGGSRGEEQLAEIDRRLQALGVQFFAGSLDVLRDMIVGEFRAVVSILQKIALWAMAIASLGVGFSMAANVHSRRRQLAVLRAVGMTQAQLARLVLAEAVTIALIGSFLGIVHGLHLAMNATYFDRVLFGLTPAWTLQPAVLSLAIAFAVVCCLVASLVPALRAGRTNVLAAMRQL